MPLNSEEYIALVLLTLRLTSSDNDGRASVLVEGPTSSVEGRSTAADIVKVTLLLSGIQFLQSLAFFHFLRYARLRNRTR